MNRMIAFIVLFFLTLSATLSHAGISDMIAGDPLDEARVLLLKKINEARMHPVETAAAFGISKSQLFEKVPELEAALLVGLPALTEHKSLNTVALAHTRDMLENNFYGYDSSDGIGWENRLRGAGFEGAVVGETLGVVGFQNYMDIDTAVDRLFTNLILDELDLNRSGKNPTLLNPALTRIGLGVCAGQITLNGRRVNVYLLTCDFASVPFFEVLTQDDFQIAEAEFVQLINQGRDNPGRVVASLGGESLAEAGRMPLIGNAALKRVAAARVENMAAGKPEGDDGEDLEQQLMEAGFLPISWGETRRIERVADHTSFTTLIQSAFNEMLLTELQSSGEEKRNLMNADYREMGVSFELGRYDFGEGPEIVLFIDCIFGESGNPVSSVAGLVYEDKNGNGIYDSGEGIPGRNLIIYGAGLHLKTDKAGGFSAAVEDGSYWVILFSQEDPMAQQTIMVDSENVWVMFNRGNAMAYQQQ
ncbi:MAG: hypothetical protein V2B19_32800 [Pseudomonadota bacterium]